MVRLKPDPTYEREAGLRPTRHVGAGFSRLFLIATFAVLAAGLTPVTPDLKVGPSTSQSQSATSQSGPAVGPTFRLGAPPAAAFDPTSAFAPAVDFASKLPRLHSLLVSWRGDLVLERYFNGIRATQLANMKSASKSVISALVGIAIERGYLPGVETPIDRYFPDVLSGSPPKRAITIEDLLTMRSGLETTSNRNYGAWVLSRNWVTHALNRPLVTEPGTRMVYSTGNSHLLSAILTKATGSNTKRFAQDTLASPLGFTLADWPRDPQGVYFGGNDMLMTPKQMLGFGELFLNRGMVNDKSVVPATWVDESFVARTESPRAGDRSYGYSWWVRDLAGYEAFYAWGYGGQFIFVVPDLDLVVVTSSVSTPSDDRRGHNGRIYDLVEEFIIPALPEQ